MAKRGYGIRLLVSDGKPSSYRNGVEIVSVGYSSSFLHRFFITHPRILISVLRSDHTICHIHDPELIVLGLLLKIAGRTVVYDIHENTKWQLEAGARKSFLRQVVRPFVYDELEKIAAKFIDGLVASGPNIYKRFKGSKCPVVMVRNFPTDIYLRSESVPDGNNLVYVGLISEERGIMEILDVLQHVPNGLILAGDFHTEEIERRVKGHVAWKKVAYHGVIDMDQIPDILAQASIGLCTLHHTDNHINTYAIKMFEYMAVGLPIIVSDFPLWRVIVKKYDCGFVVDPLDTRETINAIEWINKNPDQALAMGGRGKVAIQKEFKWSTEVDSLDTFYRSLVASN